MGATVGLAVLSTLAASRTLQSAAGARTFQIGGFHVAFDGASAFLGAALLITALVLRSEPEGAAREEVHRDKAAKAPSRSGADRQCDEPSLAVELARVEVVPPGFELAVVDLEGPHDLQVECLAGKREDVDPLRHHDRTAGGDVDDAELNALDAGRTGTDERRDVGGNVLFAGDRLERNVVVDGVVGEERG